MNIDAILEALLTLGPDELKAVKAKCVYVLNKKKTNSDVEVNRFADILYMHLRSQGRKMGLTNFPTIEQAAQTKPQVITNFINKVDKIELFWLRVNFAEYFGDSKDLQEKLIVLLVSLYIKHIKSIFETINPWNLLACIDYLPQAFEAAFPEYIANDMQGVIINQFVGDKS